MKMDTWSTSILLSSAIPRWLNWMLCWLGCRTPRCSRGRSVDRLTAPDFEVMAQRTVTALAELDAAIQKHE
jgi:hypothetical protein